VAFLTFEIGMGPFLETLHIYKPGGLHRKRRADIGMGSIGQPRRQEAKENSSANDHQAAS
jgi:hypothetical protein